MRTKLREQIREVLKEEGPKPSIPGMPPVVGGESVAQEAHRLTHGSKREEYGSVEESFVRIAKLWSTYKGVEISAQDVAWMMVLLKVSRAAEAKGNPSRDTCVDTAGYASLAGELLNLKA